MISAAPTLSAGLNAGPSARPAADPGAGEGSSGTQGARRSHSVDGEAAGPAPVDAGFAAALSQFLPPPASLAKAPETPAAAPAPAAPTTPQSPAVGAEAQTSVGRAPAVDAGRPGADAIDPHTAPSVTSGTPKAPTDKPGNQGKGGGGHRGDTQGLAEGLASGLRLPATSVTDLLGAHPPRHFNDALGELMAPRGGPEAMEALRAGVEHRIRGAIMAEAAHLQLQLPGGDLGVHVQFKEGVADVRLEGTVAEAFRGRESELRSSLVARGIEVGEVRAAGPAEAASVAAGSSVDAALRTAARPETVRPGASVSVVDPALAAARPEAARTKPAGGTPDLTALQALAGRRPEAAAPFDAARAVVAAEQLQKAQWEAEAGRPAAFVAAAQDPKAPQAAPDETSSPRSLGLTDDRSAGRQGEGRQEPDADERFAPRDGTAPATLSHTPSQPRQARRSGVHVEA